MKKIAVIGAGLSGLISAYILSKESVAEITIFEKGNTFSERFLDKESNMLYGVGGAGTLAGGKFCFPPASSGVWRKTGLEISDFTYFIKNYLNEFFDESFNEDLFIPNFNKISKTGIVNKEFETKLLLENEMHRFINSILLKLMSQNVKIRTNTCLIKCSKSENANFVFYSDENSENCIESFDYVIIATGRSSANDICEWLPTKYINQVSPDLGIRITVNDKDNEIFSTYGQDVKLKASFGNISVRTFCVCSGGDSALIKYGALSYYDGHFGASLSNIVNFGVLVRNKTVVGTNNAFEFCVDLERYVKDDVTLKDVMVYGSKFLKKRSKFNYVFDAINHFVTNMVKDGFIASNLDKYQAYMPSIDRLNPIVSTNKYFETGLMNLYVVGDAAGVSRGFVQSMWSAYYASENILWKLAIERYQCKRVV